MYGDRNRIALIVTAIVIAAVSAAAMATETVTYNYDALGRLTKVVHSGTINNNQQTTYGYDNASNRTTVNTTGAPH